MSTRVSFLAPLVLLLGCGKEIGRIPLTGEGSGDAAVTVKSGEELTLWTHLDASWDGTFSPIYEVELRDVSGKAVATTTCNPMNCAVRTGSVETQVGSHHTKRYSGKMRCELTAPSSGSYTVHARLALGAKPAGLSVKDMSLVIKK
jgi:hypothetical protein